MVPGSEEGERLAPTGRKGFSFLATLPSGSKTPFRAVSGVVLVGRRLPPGPDHWSLEDEMVSARHARLTLDDGGVWIEDLQSANGTWVDGKRI
ncbi:MAG: FHA domain-containing protein, partial [Acidobacteria bacterium]|nr:FHA domain-containing protein [Acidobacteriota bacterium]